MSARRCAQRWLLDLLLSVRYLCPLNNNQIPACLMHHSPEADLAPVAAGSFLLAIVCHVNGCKNIIRPVSPDRLPPFLTAATGEGMGTDINLRGEPVRNVRCGSQQRADEIEGKQSERVVGSLAAPLLGSRELAAQRRQASENKCMSYTGS